MYKHIGAIALSFCLLFVAFSGCTAAPALPPVVSVNMQVLMTQSAPGKQAADHLAEVRKVLQQGFEDLKTTFKDRPAPELEKILAEGLNRLNTQMLAEQQAAEQIVQKIVVEEVAKWRAANKDVLMVIPSAVVIDANMEKADFTKTILAAVNKRTATFPKLPTVNIDKGEKK